MIATGTGWEGQRNVLAVELAKRESAAIVKELPGAAGQRSSVHFLRSALSYLLRMADDECMTEWHGINERRTVREARAGLTAWLKNWGGRYPRLCHCTEANTGETLTLCRLPWQHQKDLKPPPMPERLVEEIKRRTPVVRIFPSAANCLRLVKVLAAEMRENWI